MRTSQRKAFHAPGIGSVAAVALVLVLLPAASRAQNAPSSSASENSKPAASAAAPKGNAENGKLLFVKFGCYECHGREGQGGSYTGPRLAPGAFPFAFLTTYIRKPTGEMPPYTTKVVSDEELADIYAFLTSRPKPPSPDSLPLPK